MKKTIKLKESDITRMVMEAVNELDWKTYANAAKKRKEQGNWQSSDELRKQMVNSFNDKYATSDNENNSYNGINTDKSASFQMDNGAMGDEGGLVLNSKITQNNGNYPQYINRRYRSGLENDMYNQLPQQGLWYGQHGMSDDDKTTKQPITWSDKVRDKASKGINDVDNYHNGKSEYIKGKGWVDECVNKVIRKYIK